MKVRGAQGSGGSEAEKPPLEHLLPIKEMLFDSGPDVSRKGIKEIKSRGASKAVAEEIIREIIEKTEGQGEQGAGPRIGYALTEWVQGVAAVGDAAVEPLIENIARTIKNRPTGKDSKVQKEPHYHEFRYWVLSALRRIGTPEAENALTRRLSSFYRGRGYLAIEGSTSAVREYAAERNDLVPDYKSTEGRVVMNIPFEYWDSMRGNNLMVVPVKAGTREATFYQWLGYLRKVYRDTNIGVLIGKMRGRIVVKVGDKTIDDWGKPFSLDEARQNGIWVYRKTPK
jgi:hypothetical protein